MSDGLRPAMTESKVDVLTWVRTATNGLHCLCQNSPAALRGDEVKRALAELFDAASNLRVLGDGRAYFESGADTERFRAALAACTPAKEEGR